MPAGKIGAIYLLKLLEVIPEEGQIYVSCVVVTPAEGIVLPVIAFPAYVDLNDVGIQLRDLSGVRAITVDIFQPDVILIEGAAIEENVTLIIPGALRKMQTPKGWVCSGMVEYIGNF